MFSREKAKARRGAGRVVVSANYICDGAEQLLAVEGLPQPLLGAPELKLIRANHVLVVAYYVDDGARGGVTELECTSETGHKHQYAVVRMKEYCVALSPRGEVGRDDHPLTRNLGEVVVEVKPSPWIRQVMPPSGWSKFARTETHWHHYLFALHDDRLEVIGQIQDVSIHQGPMDLSAIASAAQK